ncbi:Signal transduction histidine kinase, nitrogen specific, NtrB (fragment) [uncultured Desulfobacterium sp.]|uniref:histidine kinase n=1 Tax=uncultured Desulfobacterium sp. TaxID=201089 RepID=A0A445MVE6_9BACT
MKPFISGIHTDSPSIFPSVKSKTLDQDSARKIAHDFNNFLNVIIGNIEITLKRVPKKSQIRGNLEEALMASARAQALVQKMLNANRPDHNGPRPLQVSSVVKDTIRLLRTSLPVPIEFSEDLSNGNCWVMADPLQIQRIIMNLCINGYHAMDQGGGELKITIKETDIEPADSINLNMAPGVYICLSVGDDGHGIAHEAIDRIFEPYYSTKDKGKGSGLGLSIVFEIVKSCGGHIRVCSEPGRGTVFDVYLPRIDYEDRPFEAVSDEQICIQHPYHESEAYQSV